MPLHAFWRFSFESILENMHKNWQSPEVQLVHKFSRLQTLSLMELPQEMPADLKQCFLQMREAKTSHSDPVL